ncbi:adenylate cyclase regulatory protein [Carex littledalei]|uniref:Adenylate cyclase regulatory protein n=1 Tax=Carex littledalei TaxID=544730 RepID=A0A833RN89_9POAL|nr:adenylate cyclase regulatory protein [Carex littledalei]
MDPVSIAAVGWSITAVGWLMGALVTKAVTGLLEKWAKRSGLGDEFKTLKRQLLLLGALLASAYRRRTDNSFLEELVQGLQQLAYQAENLFDEMDYYRLQEDKIQQRDAFSAPDVTGINLSLRMKELAEQLQKSVEEVRNAVGTESTVTTAEDTERRTRFINFMLYHEDLDRLGFDLTLNYCSSVKLGEVLAFHELRSLRVLQITCISSLESMELNSFVNLVNLDIRECQSLTSITFGDHLDHLRFLTIMSCNALSSMKGLKSWVNLERLLFRKCPGFIAAWDTALKEIETTEPWSLTEIDGDSLALLTLPICKHLTSLQKFYLEVSTTEEPEISLQLLTSIDLVDIRGCKNLQSFPFDLFPSLKKLGTEFPRIQSLSLDSRTEITEECLKLRNIKEVYIRKFPVQVIL